MGRDWTNKSVQREFYFEMSFLKLNAIEFENCSAWCLYEKNVLQEYGGTESFARFGNDLIDEM
jgi:hypothetical protein